MKKDKNIALHKETIFNIKENIKGELDLDNQSQVAVILKNGTIPNAPDYIMMWQAIGTLISKNCSSSTIHVLWSFMNLTQYGNHVGIDQQTLAENTNLGLRTIQKAIHDLKEGNIIIPYNDVQDRRRNVYIINPVVAWKGKLTTMKQTVKKLKENKLQLDLNFKDYKNVVDETQGTEIFYPEFAKAMPKISQTKGKEEDFADE